MFVNTSHVETCVLLSKLKSSKSVSIELDLDDLEITAAEAKANAVLESAEAEKQARIKEAEGQIARFSAMYDEYVKFPSITKTRMYYETMEELLPNMKIIIQDSNGNIVNVLGGMQTIYGNNTNGY